MQRVIKSWDPRGRDGQLCLALGCQAYHFQGVPHCPLCCPSNTPESPNPFDPALVKQEFQPNLSSVLCRRQSPAPQRLMLLAATGVASYVTCGFRTMYSYSMFLQGTLVVMETSPFAGPLMRGNEPTLKHGGLKLVLWRHLHDACLDLFLGSGG